MEGEKKIIDD